MDNNKTKKELQAKYKERKIIGGVYVIKNTHNGKLLLGAVTNLQGSKNRFEFAQAQNSGSCVSMKLYADWKAHGKDKFVYEVLEELEKGELQTAAEFEADIDFLKKIWLEKLSDKDFY